MNAYEATKRIYAISDELSILSKELGAAVKETNRNLIRTEKINILENEFFNIKHKLAKDPADCRKFIGLQRGNKRLNPQTKDKP